MDKGDKIDSFEVLVTASEAFPALERLFLEAEREIIAGFRIFDLRTKLRSDEARAIGETWFDLFAHTLDRGVSISMMLSDFDPIVGTKYHRKSWQSAQQLAAAKELEQKGRLDYRIALHPAKAGFVPRALLWVKVREKFLKKLKDEYTPALSKMSPGSFFDLSPVTHHQKLAVFDRKTLYIGGLDVDERRFDTLEHHQDASETWQDVQVIVTGEVAKAAHRHLETLEAVVERKAEPPESAPPFLRTVSTKRHFAPFHLSPKVRVTEIEEAHMDAIARSKHFIYLETQFFRHQPLAEALIAAKAENPDLKLIVIVPAAPEDVAFFGNVGEDARMGEHLQAEAVSMVRDAFGDDVLFCSPAQPRAVKQNGDRSSYHGAPIIYVHSKVSIFDDREAIVSSANLNGRSFRWDTEAGIHLTRTDHVAQIAKRLLDHWVPGSGVLPDATPHEILAQWRETLDRNVKCYPDERGSFLLPYDEEAARKLGEAMPVVPHELV